MQKTTATVIIGAVAAGLAAAAPQIMPIIPTDYAAIAAGFITLITSIFHLYQPAPATK